MHGQIFIILYALALRQRPSTNVITLLLTFELKERDLRRLRIAWIILWPLNFDVCRASCHLSIKIAEFEGNVLRSTNVVHDS